MDQRLRVFFLTIFLGVFFIPSSTAAALAFPVLPSSYYGVVQYGGSNVVDGTLVEALLGDQVLASATTRTYQGSSVYSLDVRGDESETTAIDGAHEGDTIRFRVGGVMAKETGIWHSGTNTALNLSVPASAALDDPQPTHVPVPSQTAIPTRQPNTSTQVTFPVYPSETHPAAAPTNLAVDQPGDTGETGTTGWIISSTALSKPQSTPPSTHVPNLTAAAQDIEMGIDSVSADDAARKMRLTALGVLLITGLMAVVWFRSRK